MVLAENLAVPAVVAPSVVAPSVVAPSVVAADTLGFVVAVAVVPVEACHRLNQCFEH